LNEQLSKNILDALDRQYPNPVTALKYSTPFQLLIATMLSAQSTDKQVNKVTEVLFKDYGTVQKMNCLSLQQLQEYIKGCGLYKTKAKNIKKTCEIIIDQYNGRVPDDFHLLQKLPGVGRKTANVVLSNAFGRDAIAVDTHVFRVANRIGLANSKSVLETEKQLMENIPRDKWSRAHHWLIYHGRNICKARKPLCGECAIREMCAYYKNKSLTT
jgi:endonuclease-3